jgi:carbon-monoxide dehydrogenase medium subunit
VLASADVRRVQPLVSLALADVAHATIRNRGTTVGSVVHADPSGEMPAVLSLLGGRVHAVSVRGEREVAAGGLFAGPLETTLADDELVVAMTVPARRPGEGTAVVEVARRHGDYAVLGVVAQVLVDDGAVTGARAAYVSAGEPGAVADLVAPVRGERADTADWAACGDLAAGEVEVEADIHASAAYRTSLVRALTARALAAACDHALEGATGTPADHVEVPA